MEGFRGVDVTATVQKDGLKRRLIAMGMSGYEGCGRTFGIYDVAEFFRCTP